MDIESKIKQDMRKLGCLSHHRISLAFHLYLYLVFEEMMYDTEYFYNMEIDTLYLLARPNKNSNLNIYVPMPSSNDLDLRYIALLHDNLCTIETGHTVNLAFITEDLSTTIYPFPKDTYRRQASEQAKFHRIYKDRRGNNEFCKKKYEILDNAYYRDPIDY